MKWRKGALASLPVIVGTLLLVGLATRAIAFGFAEQPSKPVALGGTWQLNGALSDDVHKAVAEHQQKLVAAMEKMRRRMPRQQEPSLYPTEEEAIGPGPSRMIREPMMSVESYEHLKIDQTPDHFVIDRESPSGHIDHQSYDPGESSVVSFGAGVADRRAGWKGKSFVIETRAVSGVRRQETYQLDAMAHLVVQTVITGRGPKLEVKQVYDRAERAP